MYSFFDFRFSFKNKKHKKYFNYRLKLFYKKLNSLCLKITTIYESRIIPQTKCIQTNHAKGDSSIYSFGPILKQTEVSANSRCFISAQFDNFSRRFSYFLCLFSYLADPLGNVQRLRIRKTIKRKQLA